MSQFFQGVTTGSLPPVVATSYVTDVNSPAIPIAGVLNVIGGTSTVNNANGIRTDGSSGSNTLTAQLTNRIQGSVSTTGVVTNTIITFPLGSTPGTYTIRLEAAGFNASTPASTSYFEFICAATDGSIARIVSAGDSDEICLEDAALNSSDIVISASGNNVLIQAQGVLGLTIDWVATGIYTFSS